MKLCIDYLHEIERLKGWSPYRISKEVGLTSQRMYQLFNEGGTYNDETAFQVARILELEPAVVMAAANAERAKSPEIKAVWTDLLEKISMGFNFFISNAKPRGGLFPAG